MRARATFIAAAIAALSVSCGGSSAGSPDATSRCVEPAMAPTRSEAAERAKLAATAAAAIEKDVAAAHSTVKQIGDTLADALARLAAKQLPVDAAGKLEGASVAFNGESLADGRASDLPHALLRSLFTYAVGTQKLSRDKDKLRTLLGITQPHIEKHWKESIAPVVSFSVLLRPEGKKGMIAELVPNKEPFPADADWPSSYAVLVADPAAVPRRILEKKATRWVNGPLKGAEPIAIPIVPASVAAFTGEELTLKLTAALRSAREAIEGDESDPEDMEPGLLKQGEVLLGELRKLSQLKPASR